MLKILNNIAQKFPARGYPCRGDFWLWVGLAVILLFNILLVGDPLP